jgi:hypothetical protein
VLLTRVVGCMYSGLQIPCFYVQAPCDAIVVGQAEAPELWHGTSPCCGRVSHKWFESALIWIKSWRGRIPTASRASLFCGQWAESSISVSGSQLLDTGTAVGKMMLVGIGLWVTVRSAPPTL